MNKTLPFALFSILAVILAVGCHWNLGRYQAVDNDNWETVVMTFRLELNRQVYEDSTWGDPPQLAIWLRNQADQSIRTVLVTYRTATCDWIGKVECSVALPYWVTFFNKQTGTHGPPRWDSPAADAITFATPIASLAAVVEVPRGTRWRYFVEVNVSGDFNKSFPSFSAEGFSDRYGNGQPSLVYHGYIEAADDSASRPELLGRTEQYKAIDYLIEDLESITSAKNLLKKVYVSCKEKS
jgi:hypothetical protein